MWTQTMYLQCADQAAWEALATSMGDLGASNAAVYLCEAPAAPWETLPVWGTDEQGEPTITTPGVPMAGYWVMLRLNQDWDGCAAALAAINTAGVSRTLNEPPWVFA